MKLLNSALAADISAVIKWHNYNFSEINIIIAELFYLQLNNVGFLYVLMSVHQLE